MDGEKTCGKWGDVYQSYPLDVAMRLAEPSSSSKRYDGGVLLQTGRCVSIVSIGRSDETCRALFIVKKV
jgi:hypothetical protein